MVKWGIHWFVVVAVLGDVAHARADQPFDVQAAIATAKSGDTIKLPAGFFKLDKTLTLWKENLRLSGSGKDLTVLDFSEATEGGQGILVRAPGVAVEGISIIDPPGDGLVARGVGRLSLRDIRVGWVSRQPGGYGIYPVQCRNVVLDDLVVSGAVEAGIYIGQTSGARITDSYVFNNVVGIDIENSSSVVVQNNISKNNSIGVVVTGRPFLFLKNPKYISLVQNTLVGNNLVNFAPEASFVKSLGSGIGLVLTAVREVSVLENVIEGHQGSSVEIINYKTIDPFFEGDSSFDSGFSGAKFYGNIFGKNDESPSLTILAERHPRVYVGSTVSVTGYDHQDINANFACFHTSVDGAAFLSSIDYFLSSTLPCDFNHNIRK